MNKLVPLVFVLLSSAVNAASTLEVLQNYGSDNRSSQNFVLKPDRIESITPAKGISANYSLNSEGGPTVACGISINEGSSLTNQLGVQLGLGCAAENGCSTMSFSENNVTWTEEEPYSTAKSYAFSPGDGNRPVYVRFTSGDGIQSSPCSSSILIDTGAPFVSFSPEGGTYIGQRNIALTSSENGMVRYTTDGTAPDESSDSYESPLTLSVDTTIKAFATDTADNSGPVSEASYTICDARNLTISGEVRDTVVDQVVPLVTLSLSDGQSVTTDLDGAYSFTGLRSGNYTIESITAPAEGYVSFQSRFELCRDNINNDIELVKNNSVFGVESAAGYSADSVNTSTGNFALRQTDFSIAGRGLSFILERGYNSQDGSDGPFGYGWTHNHNVSLTVGAEGDVGVRWGDGKLETWLPNGSAYTPNTGVFSELTKLGDGTFEVTLRDKHVYRFQTSGELIDYSDEHGNTISYVYSGSLLSKIIDTVDREIELTYDAQNRITRISDFTGRSVTYSYSANGDLSTVTDPLGNSTQYRYTEDHQLVTVIDPLGYESINITYDDVRRAVASQRDAAGGELLYTYDTVSRATQIIDPLGNTSYHFYDEHLRLIKETDALGHSSFYEFDERGSVVKHTDNMGFVTSYTYDSKGNVLTKTDPLGHITSATYDAQSNPLTKTDANGNVTSFTYSADQQSNLLKITNAIGHEVNYTYNEFGQLLTVTDARGNTTTNEYNFLGQLVAKIDAKGHRFEFRYDDLGRKVFEDSGEGRTAAFSYDLLDRLLTSTDALGGVNSYEYDANGNKTKHTAARGNSTAFEYDNKNRLLAVTSPTGSIEQYTYDALDRKLTITDPRGFTTRIVYDAVGNVIQEIDQEGNRVSHEFDPNGRRILTIDAAGFETVYEYDDAGRMTSTTEPTGLTFSILYDAQGNILAERNSAGEEREYVYTQLNQRSVVKDALGSERTTTFDENGNTLTVTNFKGQVTQYEWDELDRPIRVVSSSGVDARATYDSVGNRIELFTPGGGVISSTYDVLGRLVREDDAAGYTELFEYDENGNLVSYTDGNGTLLRAFDSENRVTSVRLANGDFISFRYNESGNVVERIEAAGTTRQTYDARGAIASKTDVFGMTLAYGYNAIGQLSSIRYPENLVVGYRYDELGRLASVKDWQGNVTGYTYDNNGKPKSIELGNGFRKEFEFDEAGRLIRTSDKDKAGEVVIDHLFTRDALGNVLRLDSKQPLDYEVEFERTSSEFDQSNRLQSINDQNVTYTPAGNRKSDASGSFEYDQSNRLTELTSGDQTHQYQYNILGERISAIRNGKETKHLIHSDGKLEHLLAEVAEDQIESYYIYGNGLLYSIDASSGAVSYYHFDNSGNTLALSDSSGTITDKYAYSPFGDIKQEGSNRNPFLFAGEYGVYKETENLFHMRSRFYDSHSRQFMSPDPIKAGVENFDSINRFAYAHNNPLIKVDPDGEVVFVLPLLVIGAKALAVKGGYVAAAKVGGAGVAKLSASAVAKKVGFQVGKNVLLDGAFSAGGELIDYVYGAEAGESSLAASGFEAFASSVTAFTNSSPAGQLGSAAQSALWGAGGWVLSRFRKEPAEDEFTSSGSESACFCSTNRYNERMVSMESSRVLVSARSGGAASNVRSSAAVASSRVSFKQISASGFNRRTSVQSRKYLNVGKKARRHFRKQFVRLTDARFLDAQTRTGIELLIENEIYQLQANNRYGYKNAKQKRRRSAQLDRDLQQSSSRLYTQLVSALSKHQVIVSDLQRLPGTARRAGGVFQ